ncbi:outer membrane lipoprotein carrier protein LolA [Streptomyces sp. NPDC057638]|uniref:LolA family protein n=1 Tax=Streptomyces sp. NPDC057638 TaxID=3346190 RepID=UPI003698191C
MDANDSAQTTGPTQGSSAGRRKTARYLVPVAVAGVAAATIGLVPALAASGDPDLPDITAQQLIEKIAASDTQRLSGMVKIRTDLGLPSLGGLGEGLMSSVAPEGEGAGSSAAPESKLMELASGSHTLRVAIDGPERQKLSILEKNAEYSLIHDGGELWGYDSGSNEVFHAKETQPGGKGEGGEARRPVPPTPRALATETLKAVGDTTSVTVGSTARIADRDAYQLVIKPKQGGSTIGSVKIAVDARTGTPLAFTVTPSGGGKAAIDVGFTSVDFSRPAASTFDFTPPKDAKVTEAKEGGRGEPGKAAGHPGAGPEASAFKGLDVLGKGWGSVVKLASPGGDAKVPTPSELAKSDEVPAEAKGLLSSFGDEVRGDFGTGTVFSTRLVNALITQDGTVYTGAVTKDVLVKAANADAK